MLSNLKTLLSITSSDYDYLLNLLIEMAKDLAKRTIYPFEDDYDEIVLSRKYDYWVVLAAKEMYQNLGNENVRSYSENGLSISYNELQGGISKSLLGQLTSKVGIPQ